MAKKQKPLLQEGTVRRMMKLANMEALGNGFISEKWTGEKAGDEGAGKDKDDTDYSGKGMRKDDLSDTGRGKDDVNEQEERLQEEDIEDELDATEDELGAQDEFADEEGDEIGDLEADVDAGVGEVTITDEEAQDIIDLADKLKGAVGEEPEGDLEIEAEEEIDLEEPATRPYEENLDEDALYEAALKGLQIDLINDKKEQKQTRLREAKRRIYKRVIKRLLEGSKKKIKSKSDKILKEFISPEGANVLRYLNDTATPMEVIEILQRVKAQGFKVILQDTPENIPKE